MTYVLHETIPALTLSSMTVSRLRHSPPEGVPCPARLHVDGYSVEIHMRPLPRHRLWRDNRLVSDGPLPEGALFVRECGPCWRFDYPKGVDAIVLRIPLIEIRDFATAAGRPEFTCLRGTHGMPDPSLHGLAQALMPVFDGPGAASQLFLDQMGFAVLAHLTQRYGGLTFPSIRKGGLAPWQEARATEFLAANITGHFSLEDLAIACELSRSYFNKAFKTSFGKSPLRWLAEYRVARACDLLRTHTPISEIALACGFADQSHLTRVFSGIMGESPGTWRRSRLGESLPRHAPGLKFHRETAS